MQPIKDLFDIELKWDYTTNHRRLFINFSSEPKNSIENQKKLQINWYRHLIQEQPEILYFLVPEQFVEALIANSYKHETDFKISHTLESAVINLQLKTYILQTLEDLVRFEVAPVTLVKPIYEQVNTLDTFRSIRSC